MLIRTGFLTGMTSLRALIAAYILRYAGVKVEDLLEIYCLFIRSVAEYNSVVFHDLLTTEQSHSLGKCKLFV